MITRLVGDAVGVLVGVLVGFFVGLFVGFRVGLLVGCPVGENVGLPVGPLVGLLVGISASEVSEVTEELPVTELPELDGIVGLPVGTCALIPPARKAKTVTKSVGI